MANHDITMNMYTDWIIREIAGQASYRFIDWNNKYPNNAYIDIAQNVKNNLDRVFNCDTKNYAFDRFDIPDHAYMLVSLMAGNVSYATLMIHKLLQVCAKQHSGKVPKGYLVCINDFIKCFPTFYDCEGIHYDMEYWDHLYQDTITPLGNSLMDDPIYWEILLEKQ